MNIKFIGQKNGKTHVNDKQHTMIVQEFVTLQEFVIVDFLSLTPSWLLQILHVHS